MPCVTNYLTSPCSLNWHPQVPIDFKFSCMQFQIRLTYIILLENVKNRSKSPVYCNLFKFTSTKQTPSDYLDKMMHGRRIVPFPS